jgi:hypothetical protein
VSDFWRNLSENCNLEGQEGVYGVDNKMDLKKDGARKLGDQNWLGIVSKGGLLC